MKKTKDVFRFVLNGWCGRSVPVVFVAAENERNGNFFQRGEVTWWIWSHRRGWDVIRRWDLVVDYL